MGGQGRRRQAVGPRRGRHEGRPRRDGGSARRVGARDEPSRARLFACVIDEEDAGRGRARRSPTGSRDWAVIGEPTELRAVRAANGNCYLGVEVHGRPPTPAPRPGRECDPRPARRWSGRVARSTASCAARPPRADPAPHGRRRHRGGLLVSAVRPTARSGSTGARCRARTAPARSPIWSASRRVADRAARGPGERRMTMEMPPFETPAGHPLLGPVGGGAEAAAGGRAGRRRGRTRHATAASFTATARDPRSSCSARAASPRPTSRTSRCRSPDLPIAARTYAAARPPRA